MAFVDSAPISKSEYNKQLFDSFLNYFETMKQEILEWKNNITTTAAFNDSNIVLAKVGEQYFLFKRDVSSMDWSEEESPDFEKNYSVFSGTVSSYPNNDEIQVISDYYQVSDASFVVSKINEKSWDDSSKKWIQRRLEKSYPVMVYRIGKLDDFENFILLLVNNNLCPASLSNNENSLSIFKNLVTEISNDKNYLKINPEVGKLSLNHELLYKSLQNNPVLVDKLSMNLRNISSEEVIDNLLKSDVLRAGFEEPYTESVLLDEGHWDLYVDKENLAYSIKLNKKYNARNPEDDLNKDGTVAIDFGTKSTVVVGYTGKGRATPIAIGKDNKDSNYNDKYENPTVMYFKDIETFLNDYKSKIGRPNTKFEDLVVSHIAKEQYEGSSANLNASFLNQIKQWAGNSEKSLTIKTFKDVENNDFDTYEFDPFLKLSDDKLNPIEIYAYYIGLYINRMNRGIYLDYYMSFPVTYGDEVRDKIVKSFEKGLKKSLPESILNNKEIMEDFNVKGILCEPAAYAVTALQEYKFEPVQDEKVRYAVFDFGGGTSDFDYGTWEKRKGNGYKLNNFVDMAGGVKTLGGENLLEGLAFEIFKQNREELKKQNCCFTFGPTVEKFDGWEDVVQTNQKSKQNMQNLIRELRPYWEDSENFQMENFEETFKILRNNDFELLDSDEMYRIISKFQRILRERNVLFNNGEEISTVQELLDDVVSTLADDKNISTSTSSSILDIFGRKNGNIVQDDNKNILITAFIKLSTTYEEHFKEKLSMDSYSDDVDFSILITDKNGNETSDFSIKTKKSFIYSYIEKKIREGVHTFFQQLSETFKFETLGDDEKVNIFLAGNSSKSPIFLRIFREKMKSFSKDFADKIANDKFDSSKMFELFPPLKSESAIRKMKERGIEVDSATLFERPSMKTGVAYGLIKCAAGGNVKYNPIKNTVPCAWYVGFDNNGYFQYVGSEKSKKLDINVWYTAQKIDEDDVDDIVITKIGSSDNLNCCTSNFPSDDSSIKWQRCKIVLDTSKVEDSSNVFLFVKAIDVNNIVYVLAKTDNPSEVDSAKLTEEKSLKLN